MLLIHVSSQGAFGSMNLKWRNSEHVRNSPKCWPPLTPNREMFQFVLLYWKTLNCVVVCQINIFVSSPKWRNYNDHPKHMSIVTVKNLHKLILLLRLWFPLKKILTIHQVWILFKARKLYWSLNTHFNRPLNQLAVKIFLKLILTILHNFL